MGDQIPNSFLDAYAGKSTKDAIQKAEAWIEKVRLSKARKTFLKKGTQYRRREFKSKVRNSSAYDLLLANDVYLRCLSILSTFYLEALVGLKEKKSPDSIRAVTSLLLYIWQTSGSARECILRDDDLSARILIRSIIEASDYLLAIWDDAALASDYVKAGDDFRAIWSKKLRPKEIKKLRKRALDQFFEQDQVAVKEMSEFLDQEFEMFSRATHPTYEAGLMLLFDTYGTGEVHETDWKFLNSWPQMRSAAILSVIPALPISITALECLTLDDAKHHHFRLSALDDSVFKLDREALVAVFHGLVFSSVLATIVFNSRDASNEN